MDLRVAGEEVVEDKDPISLRFEPYFHMSPVYSFYHDHHHHESYLDDDLHYLCVEDSHTLLKHHLCYAWLLFYPDLDPFLFHHEMSLFLYLNHLFQMILFHFLHRNYLALQK
jgi:hypothetical protein